MTARALRVVLALACGLLAALVTAAPASAHAALVRTDPSPRAILDSAPRQVTLTFSEGVSPVAKDVSVVAPDGRAVDVGKPSKAAGGKQVVIRLRPGLDKGTYLVTYRVISDDGHPVGGGYLFSVVEPSKPAGKVPAGTEAPVDQTVQTVVFYGKYAGYAGASMLAGAVLVLLALWPRRLNHRRVAAIGVTGWVLLLNGTAVGLYAQVPYANGGGLGDVRGADVLDMLTSLRGYAALARVALLLAALPLLVRLFKRGELPAWGRWALLGMGVLATFTWPLYGHGATSPGRLLSVPAGAVHMGAMAIWLGGLIVLAATLLARGRAKELPLVLAVWSRWALYAVVALAFTGVVQALLEVGPLGEILSHTYGRLVVFKTVGLAVIVGVAALSRRWVRTRALLLSELEPEERSASAMGLRRHVSMEIALAAIVVGLATLLTQTPPGYSDSDRGLASENLPYTTTITAGSLSLQVDVDPARKGNNTLHLTAFDRDGKPLKVVQWQATAELPEAGISRVDIPLLQIGNHMQGDVYLPRAGEWRFRFVLRMSDVDQVTLGRVIRIA